MWGGDPQRTNAAAVSTPAATELQVRWRFSAESWSASSPVVADGTVYFGAADGSVYAVDAAGQLGWSYETGGPVLSTAAVADGAVFVGSMDHGLYALDAQTGAVRWRFETDSWIVSSPLPARGLILVGSADGNLYALDAASGSLVWSFPTGDWVVSSPVTDGQTVVVGSWSGTVFGLDLLSGKEMWRVDLNQPVVATPLISNGKVFVSSLGQAPDIPFPELVAKGIDLLSGPGIFNIGEIIWPYVSGPASLVERRGDANAQLFAFNLRSGEALWDASVEGWIVGSPALFIPPEDVAPTPTPPPPGESASIEERARYIESMLGCPVCPEDVSLREARVSMADQTRQTIRQKVEEGESRQTILQYFVERFGESVLYSPPPALHNRSVVLSTTAGYKYAFHVDTGETLLELTSGNIGPISSSPLIVGRTLYVVNAYGQGQIYDLLSATSRGIGGFDTPAGSFSSLAFHDGMLYAVSETGQLTEYSQPAYRLEIGEPSPIYPGGTVSAPGHVPSSGVRVRHPVNVV